MTTRGYLDYQSGAPVDPRVVEAMLPYMTEHYGNPASLHSFGDPARDALGSARGQVAELIGADPKEIVFTSGATEASNMALKGAAARRKEQRGHIVSTAIEHRSVITPLKLLERQGLSVTYLPVDGEAFVDPERVKEALTPETFLVSVMTANGEVGTIEPVGQIATLAREKGGRPSVGADRRVHASVRFGHALVKRHLRPEGRRRSLH
jgi:cysteine desulfurase